MTVHGHQFPGGDGPYVQLPITNKVKCCFQSRENNEVKARVPIIKVITYIMGQQVTLNLVYGNCTQN